MIPSTRAMVIKPPRDDSAETETTSIVAASEADNGFDQKDLPEVVENEDGSATVLPFPGAEAKPELDETDFDANLAIALEEDELCKICRDLVQVIERDQEACVDRDKMYADGLKRTGMGDDAPGGADFEGASRVSHPVLTEACVDFEARAIKELYPPNGPVKTSITGGDRSPKRERTAQQKRATLNWVLSKGSPEYKSELEQTLSQVPMGGSQYIKTRPDLDMNKIAFEFVPLDDIWVAYGATSFYGAQRRTHRQLISRMEFENRVASGLYRDVVDVANDSPHLELSDVAIANAKIEGVEDSYYNDDGLREVYEVDTYLRLDGDDRLSPYLVHIDKSSEQVLGLYRNWQQDDKYRVRLDWIVEWGFIPWRGPYKLGLPHLAGKLAAAATGALRALLDSAHISNAATALSLGGTRRDGQNVDIAIGQVTEIQGPPGVVDIRQLAMPLPFKGPDGTLFQLLGFLVDSAKGVVTTAEEKIADASNNMPVGTSLALIEQGSKVYASIHARLHDSQAKVLEIVCRILAAYPQFLDRAKQDLGDLCAAPDVFTSTDDICPVSDPNIFSEAQRYAQLQAVMQMQAAAPQLPWKLDELNRRGLQLLNFPDPDSVLPAAVEPVTSDPVNENAMAIVKNAPLKASPQQDHLAHLREHLRFITDPLGGASPMMPGPAVGAIFQHCSEHLAYLYVTHTAMVGPEIAEQALGQGHKPNADTLSAAAAGLGAQKFAQMPEIQQLQQLLQAAQKVVQGKQPPGPMDPTQATLQAAQAETNRQAERDKSEMQLKQQQMQLQNAQKMQELQVEVQSILDASQRQREEMDLKWEQMRAQWANAASGAAKVGMQNDGEVLELLRQIQARLVQPDPSHDTRLLQAQIEAASKSAPPQPSQPMQQPVGGPGQPPGGPPPPPAQPGQQPGPPQLPQS